MTLDHLTGSEKLLSNEVPARNTMSTVTVLGRFKSFKR